MSKLKMRCRRLKSIGIYRLIIGFLGEIKVPI